jgi:zinc-ribbon domain
MQPPQELDSEARCPWCGNPLPDDAEFCPRCGNARRGMWTTITRFRFTLGNNVLAASLVIAAAFAVTYRIVESRALLQTYAAFVGLPLLIGVLTAYLVNPRNGLTATLKITTVILCVLCVLLGEGTVCIIMAAPIFYAVAIIGYALVAGAVKLLDAAGHRHRGGPMIVVLLPFLVAHLTSDRMGIRNPRTITVQSDRMIAAPPAVVWKTLLQADHVATEFPFFLRLGFPLPTGIERQPGGLMRVTFDPGSEPWPGSNVIVSRQFTDESRHCVTFVIIEDGTKLARWLVFQQTHFEIEPAEGGARLRQSTTFQQRMQPGLYWNALESFAMRQMHDYALSHLKRLAEASITERKIVHSSKTARVPSP